MRGFPRLPPLAYCLSPVFTFTGRTSAEPAILRHGKYSTFYRNGGTLRAENHAQTEKRDKDTDKRSSGGVRFAKSEIAKWQVYRGYEKRLAAASRELTKNTLKNLLKFTTNFVKPYGRLCVWFLSGCVGRTRRRSSRQRDVPSGQRPQRPTVHRAGCRRCCTRHRRIA